MKLCNGYSPLSFIRAHTPNWYSSEKAARENQPQCCGSVCFCIAVWLLFPLHLFLSALKAESVVLSMKVSTSFCGIFRSFPPSLVFFHLCDHHQTEVQFGVQAHEPRSTHTHTLTHHRFAWDGVCFAKLCSSCEILNVQHASFLGLVYYSVLR